MKTLSIRQPWAWLIVNGYKNVENRKWSTKTRGWILIHAGLRYDHAGDNWVRANFPDIPLPGGNGRWKAADWELGGIVGVANIIGVTDKPCSDWFSGPFGFVFGDTHPMPFFPAVGRLGFFDIPLPPGYPEYLAK